MNKDYEFIRAELWKEVVVAYVSSSNSVNPTGGEVWADAALKAFDKRFEQRLKNYDEAES